MIIENSAIYVLRCSSARQQYFSSLDLSLIAGNKNFLKTVKPLFSDKTSRRNTISLMEGGETITGDLQIPEIR